MDLLSQTELCAPALRSGADRIDYLCVETVKALSPEPVGGIAELPDADRAPLGTEGSSGLGEGAIAGIAAGVAALAVALSGGAWYMRRRLT